MVSTHPEATGDQADRAIGPLTGEACAPNQLGVGSGICPVAGHDGEGGRRVGTVGDHTEVRRGWRCLCAVLSNEERSISQQLHG